MFEKILREAAASLASQADPLPPPARSKKQRTARAADYPRAASESERLLLRRVIETIADRADHGIVAVEGTNEAWAVFEQDVTRAESVAATTIPNRFTVWRRIAPPNRRFQVGAYDVEMHYTTETVGSEHVRRIAVSVYVHDEPKPMRSGAIPPRDAIHTLPKRVSLLQLLKQLLFLAARVLRQTPTEDLDLLQQFVRNLRHYYRAKKRIRIIVTATSISIALACGIAWKYAYARSGVMQAAMSLDIAHAPRAFAVMEWIDLTSSSDDRYVVYKDGTVYRELSASSVALREHIYRWTDRVAIQFGENHTYRLGRRVLRLSTIYVTPTLDLVPAWKSVADLLLGHDEQARNAPRGVIRPTTLTAYAATAGVPFRFGSRLDLVGSTPDPNTVPPVTKVRVDFGDGDPHPAVLDSNNVVHTYLGPGVYRILVQPLDRRYSTPAPVEVLVAPSKDDLPIRWQLVTVNPPPDKSGKFRMISAGLLGQPTAIPLNWWFGQIHNDLVGDYLEHLTVFVYYDDGSPSEKFRLEDRIRKNSDGKYDLVNPLLVHTWRKSGNRFISMMTYSSEHGTMYKGDGFVQVLNADFRLWRILTAQTRVQSSHLPVLWWLSPDEREHYASATMGQPWTSPVSPWLSLIKQLGGDTAKLSLLADYGDGKARIAKELLLGSATFTVGDHSWVQFAFGDFANNTYYLGETNVAIAPRHAQEQHVSE